MRWIHRLYDGFVKIARSTGPMFGFVPAPVQAKDGTYGTQRMHSQQMAQRRRQFPTD